MPVLVFETGSSFYPGWPPTSILLSAFLVARITDMHHQFLNVPWIVVDKDFVEGEGCVEKEREREREREREGGREREEAFTAAPGGRE
jgi:hypothetical protein